MIDIPKDYTLSKFLQYSGKPEKCGNYYRASCPHCREGKSWLHKKRLYFFPEKNSLFCHNCSRGWSSYRWLIEVCQLDFSTIIREIKNDHFDNFLKVDEVPEIKNYTLPKDCINLSNENQLNYYKDDKVVSTALEVLTKRRLLSAINRPKTYYVSLNDFKYKKRLVIPFFNDADEIEYYTCRALFKNQEPKFLNKVGDKTIFNLHKISEDVPYIFIFEGPIDAMFVENGVAISGTHLTHSQRSILLKKFPNHQIIYAFDNPKLDVASKEKLLKLAKLDDSIRYFLYPNEFEKFKDMNEYCMSKKLDKVDITKLIDGIKSGILPIATLN